MGGGAMANTSHHKFNMHAMDDNPFQSPETLIEDSPAAAIGRDSQKFRVGDAVIFWEKLRWFYNAWMLLFVVTVALLTRGLDVAQVWLEILIGGLFANLCYSAGPLVSAYLAWFGIRSRALDLFLFTSGTTLTMILAYMTIRW